MDYDVMLNKKFGKLKIFIKHFDNGSTPVSIQLKIVVCGLSKKDLSDMGQTALDLSNYIYRKWGFVYTSYPEFNAKGEPKNSCTFYISRENAFSSRNKNLMNFIYDNGVDVYGSGKKIDWAKKRYYENAKSVDFMYIPRFKPLLIQGIE